MLSLYIKKGININYQNLLSLEESSNKKRSNVSIKETNKSIKIDIYSSDVTALRASINSILRDLQVIEGTLSFGN
ncbi:MAG: KEOPS complex subunit Pcc1 [Candidatus Micrarchaeia archaeon]